MTDEELKELKNLSNRINNIDFAHGDNNDLYALLSAGWISVGELMPQRVTPVLVLGWCCEVCHNIRIAEWEDKWWESNHGENLHFKPEFWMPLPFPAYS